MNILISEIVERKLKNKKFKNVNKKFRIKKYFLSHFYENCILTDMKLKNSDLDENQKDLTIEFTFTHFIPPKIKPINLNFIIRNENVEG